AALTSEAGIGFIRGYADKSGHLYQLYEGAMTAAQELNQAGRYELSHLRSLEAEAIHITREVAAELERAAQCALAGSRGHPHDSGGGRGVRAAGAAVLRRQGLHRHAASGSQGVPAGPPAVSGDACRHRAQLRRGPVEAR